MCQTTLFALFWQTAYWTESFKLDRNNKPLDEWGTLSRKLTKCEAICGYCFSWLVLLPRSCATVYAARDIFCSNIITKFFLERLSRLSDAELTRVSKRYKNQICLMFTSTRRLQDWVAVGKRQILTECPPQTLTLVDGLSWLFPWFSCPCQLFILLLYSYPAYPSTAEQGGKISF